MAFLDHEGGAEFPYGKDDVFDALVKAITGIKGMKVEKKDRIGCRILAKAGVSLMSWDENIPIYLLEVSPGVTRVSVTSTPKTGVLFGGAFDLGKNRKNIEKILDKTSEILSRKPPIVLNKNVESKNQFCPECGSSVSKTSSFCNECGTNLKIQNKDDSVEKSSNTETNTNPVEEIRKAKELLDLGVINEQDFEKIKNKYLEMI